MLSDLYQLCDAFIDLVYPAVCISCGSPLDREDTLVCSFCLSSLEKIQGPYCPRCGYPVKEKPKGNFLCRECPTTKVHYNTAQAVLSYSDKKVKALIHGLKYHYQTSLSGPLGTILTDGFNLHYSKSKYDAIVPVPLHKQRLREREFNQSTLLCKHLIDYTGIPLREDLIYRTRKTPPQSNLDPIRRRSNLIGAFDALSASSLENLSFLVVDDVYTTGSTVNEISAVLKKYGARRVDVLTLARAL